MIRQGARAKVIAHRGASAYQPENTLAAFELAVAQGADLIEIDLHLTRDREIVVAHDWNLSRLGAEGAIAHKTLAEIRELDAGLGSGKRHSVPTLDEVLSQFGERISFNLELKWGPEGDYPGLEEATLARVEARGLLNRTLFSSFHDSILQQIRHLSPDARLALLLSARAEPDSALSWRTRAQRLGAEALNPHFLMANQRLVQDAHRMGMAVYAYTVDEEGWMLRLMGWGIDGLFTNHPDRMRALVDAG